MEKQLAEYRARKAKEASEQKGTFFKSLFSSKAEQPEVTSNTSSLSQFCQYTSTSGSTEHLYPRLRTCLWIVLWLFLWGFFVQVEFGSAFFVLSLLFFLYISMKSGTRRAWEPSAYSVFNENCEAIEGTLSGEQFDKELKFGAGSVGK